MKIPKAPLWLMITVVVVMWTLIALDLSDTWYDPWVVWPAWAAYSVVLISWWPRRKRDPEE